MLLYVDPSAQCALCAVHESLVHSSASPSCLQHRISFYEYTAICLSSLLSVGSFQICFPSTCLPSMQIIQRFPQTPTTFTWNPRVRRKKVFFVNSNPFPSHCPRCPCVFTGSFTWPDFKKWCVTFPHSPQPSLPTASAGIPFLEALSFPTAEMQVPYGGRHVLLSLLCHLSPREKKGRKLFLRVDPDVGSSGT